MKNPTAGQCSDTNLRVLASPAAVCGTSIYCAATNSVTTNTTWEGPLAGQLFFEGGINLSAALRAVGVNQLPCFSAFLEETRSSQSTTAVLKDFILGGFPVCGLSITKACGTSSVDSSGTFINYPVSGMVTNTGVGTLYNVTVFDTVGSSATAKQISVSPSTLGPGAQGTWSDTSTSTSSSLSDSAVAKGATSSASGAPLDVTSGNTAGATCTNKPITTLSVTKGCTTSLAAPNPTTGFGSVAITVSFSGKVCNTGVSQVTGVGLTDYPHSSDPNSTGTVIASNLTLAPAGTAGGTDCASFAGSYNPTLYDSAVGGGTGPGRYLFNDLLTITSATATVGTLQKVSGQPDPRENGTYGFTTASCPLCFGAGQCTP